ncbi:MAG TPA: ribonuclease R, partial [Stellaceae bacterium]|nr:ribonuclease R [Stellaceae bacterium]
MAFIRESPSAVGKREIARAFAVPPTDRPALRDVLRQIERSGAVTRAANRRLVGGTPLPEVTVVERFGTDEDGVPLARPVAWPGPDPGPILRLADEAGEALPLGARAAARLVALETGEIEARVLRRLDRGGDRVVGVFRQDRDGGRVT